MKKILTHPDLKAALASHNFPAWIFDGRKLAWAPVKLDREVRVKLDLDAATRAPGASVRSGAEFKVTIRPTTEINMAVLRGYLDRKVQFNSAVQEAMNFVDHLFRQGPSQRLLAIKRNFYDTKDAGEPLMDGRVVEVHKGLYASIRMSSNISNGGIGLALNADVANTCFWSGNQTLDNLICSFLGNCERTFSGITPPFLHRILAPVPRQGYPGQFEKSAAFKHLMKLRKLKFTVQHKNRTPGMGQKASTFMDIMFNNKYGEQGANARNVKFDYQGKETSVLEYYQNKYGVTLKTPNLPLIDAGKAGAIPMELCRIEPMQRYNIKLNPDQTAAMIKIAVTRPKVRKDAIEQKLKLLQMSSDPWLKSYGIEFEPNFTTTQAKVIQPPTLHFRPGTKGTVNPKFAGRWDLRGMKFWKQNAAPLANWGIVMVEGCVDARVAEHFANTFRQTFVGHGGNCPNPAKILNPPGNIARHSAEIVAWAHNEITKERGYTQLLFIVVGQKNSPHYERLKKSADIRFGILSQVVVRAHVQKNDSQYHSNVAMKVNAKLGGSTSRTDPPWKMTPGGTYFPTSRATMMIGVDISHGSPGGNLASIAAMTINCDADANRFAAVCQTNGYRVEMIGADNIDKMFSALVHEWKKGHSTPPAHIMYFRDGVAEGQFAQVMELEIKGIKRWFGTRNIPMPKFTVIVATKRHHIRFFPAMGGDKNANPLPGTLVEKEVTHPFMWDFYLNSHVAIQGTARPVHYYVLHDEMNIPVNDLQKMIYHQCYSYARSTTPVSLHPAVYYAHLAGARARCHENAPTSDGFRGGGKGHEVNRDKVAKGQTVLGDVTMRDMDAPKLMLLGGGCDPGKDMPGELRQRGFLRSSMWYI